MQVLNDQAGHRTSGGDWIKVTIGGLLSGDLLIGPAGAPALGTNVVTRIAKFAEVQNGGSCGELDVVGNNTLGNLNVATGGEGFTSVVHFTVEDVPLGVGVVHATGTTPVGDEFNGERTRTIFFVHGQAALTSFAFAAVELGLVPDVVGVLNHFNMRAHRSFPYL